MADEPLKTAKAAGPQAPAEPPRESAVDRMKRFHPVRDFLSTHEVHVPHRAPHSRRARRAITAAVVGVVLFAAWWSLIPRMDVVVEAQYHEGLFNRIAVDMRIVNSGSVDLAPVRVTLVVTDLTTNASVGSMSLNTTVKAHQTLPLNAVEFKGDQLETTYGISIVVTYTTSAGTSTKSLDFRTEEPYMNLYYSGRVA